MDVRAAVAFAAGQPLSIETIQLEGPREGEVLVRRRLEGLLSGAQRQAAE